MGLPRFTHQIFYSHSYCLIYTPRDRREALLHGEGVSWSLFFILFHYPPFSRWYFLVSKEVLVESFVLLFSYLFVSSTRSTGITGRKSVATFHACPDVSIVSIRVSGVIVMSSVVSCFRRCLLNLGHVKNFCCSVSSSPL